MSWLTLFNEKIKFFNKTHIFETKNRYTKNQESKIVNSESILNGPKLLPKSTMF